MEWVISDTHFKHENIIKYCERPFKNADHMDEHMIAKWQHRVKPEDTVYHLGDVGLLKGIHDGDSPIQRIMKRLPGRKILIRGNHDKSEGVMRDIGFDVVCQSMVVRVPNMNAVYVFMTHRPLKTRPYVDPIAVPGGVEFVIHGHIHNSTPKNRSQYTHKGEIVDIPDFNINVSVEVINYEPQSLHHVVRTYRDKLKYGK